MPSLEDILQLSCGACWFKADLHVHTPASKDFHDKISPDDIVRTALEKGIDIIAITDHNTVSWCDPIIEAARNTALTVFPGVEITTHQGHLLAIFNVDAPAKYIEDFLVKLIPRDQFGSLEAATTGGIVEVSSMIENAGGVAIAAHIDGKRGFMNTINVAKERKRAYFAPYLRGIELIDESDRDVYQKGLKPEYSRRLACIQGSDCISKGSDQHNLKDMGTRYSLIKMGERNLSGLKLALIDPDIRIRLQKDKEPNPNHVIMALWVTGGFLNGQIFRFNDNVNCLIGDTGAGKSVALELIRFCFDQPPRVSKINAEVDRLLTQQLRSLGIVHALIRKEGTFYLVERTFGIPPTPPSISRITATGSEPIEGEIDMQLFFPIKAFSQSEIIEYAREPEVRLSLTDDLIDCTSENAQIADLKAKLKENAASFNAEKSKEYNIRAQLDSLPTLQESLKQLDELLNDPRIKQHQSWYKEKTILESTSEQVASLETILESSHTSLRLEAPIKPEDIASYPNPDLLKDILTIFEEWQKAVQISNQSLNAEIKKISEKLGSLKGIWTTRFEKADSEYKQLLAEIDKDGKGLHVLSERRQQIDSQISALELLKTQLEVEILPRVRSLYSARETLLDSLQDKRKAITEKREAKAQELTEKLKNVIRLHVRHRANKSMYKNALMEIGQGSGLKTTEYNATADNTHPIPFVKEILSDDYTSLFEQTGIDKTRFEKLREFLFERKLIDELYDLQLTDVDDEIEVMLQVEAGTYKQIEDLAHGQKCMVILMIALAEGDFPLIVDQPEDALHAPGIETGIVSTLRSRRGIRQCIFATRNANIIVSADAEQILPLEADAIHGELVGCGCLDSYSQRDLVVFHVEGGEEAFNRKQNTYYLKPAT